MFAALRFGVVALAMTVMAGMATPSQAQTTGRVQLVATKAGFIFGVGGGSGTLTFQGRTYPLSVGGVSFGAQIGASRTEFIGRALNMRQARSEEHTSELQSLRHLVCRLLLEKKKKKEQ